MSGEQAPKQGDTYACDACGMTILITEDCGSDEEEAFFACCGTSMKKTGRQDG